MRDRKRQSAKQNEFDARVAQKRETLSARITTLEPSLLISMKPSDLVALAEGAIEPDDGDEWPEHDDVLFNLPKARVLLDAWIVGKFGELAGANSARLSGDQWPDGFVTFGNTRHNIEATEAQKPGRKRGAEYRANRPRTGDGGPEEWNRLAAVVPSILREAISRKTAKNYSDSSVLVILLTVPDYGTNHSEIEAHIRNCRFDRQSRFEAVHVLWKNRLYALEPDNLGDGVAQ